MQWSVFQENIFDFVSNSNKSCVVNAVAGSGKTTTIIECAKRVSKQNKSILFLAFNKSIASELEKKVKDYENIDCKTLHAHGFRAINSFKKTRMKLDDNKWSSYIKENLNILSNETFEDKSDIGTFIYTCTKLLDLCRINLIQSKDIKSIEDIAFHHNIQLNYDEVFVVSSVLEIAYELNDNIIDFVDMITLPCMNSGVKKCVKKYDVVFVDECQDLSLAQRQLLLNSIKRGGKFIAVGDPRQAINGFCGADCESFYKLKELANGNELPLSVCYRCGKNIVKLAQNIVPNIESFENSIDGKIEEVNNIDGINVGDFVICRTAAPTISLCLKLIANGKPAKVKGRDMMDGLKNMVKKSKADNFEDMYKFFEKEYNKLLKKLKNRGVEKPEESIQALTYQDKIDCIRSISETCDKFGDLIERMDNLFSDYDDGKYITLSTVHKAKGLEFDRVFIILPDKLPLKWKGQKDWEFEQEMNLCYVAYTRAKKQLFFVKLNEEQLLMR